jgi:hypothetical protein
MGAIQDSEMKNRGHLSSIPEQKTGTIQAITETQFSEKPTDQYPLKTRVRNGTIECSEKLVSDSVSILRMKVIHSLMRHHSVDINIRN